MTTIQVMQKPPPHPKASTIQVLKIARELTPARRGIYAPRHRVGFFTYRNKIIIPMPQALGKH